MAHHISIEKAFIYADSTRRGALVWQDLQVACTCLLGYTPSRVEIVSLFGDMALNADLVPITLHQFVRTMAPRMSRIDGDELFRRIFVELDTGSKGYIDATDVSRMLTLHLPHCKHSLDTATMLIRQTTNGGGQGDKVTFRKFHQIMVSLKR
ncbi:hypothetical protein BASA81_009568 [Batrachochytrium salamandrivorans]|nr:hypothetical protein BASA81_009568 [Batrachochytrium salamandrivorans]